MNAHQHDPTIIECEECGCHFDLDRQPYYGPACPRCLEAEL